MIPVNIVLHFEVVAEPDEGGTEYMAVAHWVMAGVPRQGEEVIALNHRMRVERVQWASDGRVAVHLPRFRAGVDLLEQLESEGWDVGPRQDEPPSEWFTGT